VGDVLDENAARVDEDVAEKREVDRDEGDDLLRGRQGPL
jgi:hypothetical protein